MKIGSFSGRGDYDASKPIVFDISIPDGGHIADANISLGHKTAQLHLRVVHDVSDEIVPMKMIALLNGQEHADAHESEFVQRTRAHKFTSAVAPYYLFVVPRGE